MLVQRQEIEESCTACSLSKETEERTWLGCDSGVWRPRQDLVEEDGSLSRETEEAAWLGCGTGCDLVVEEGVVEVFWIFLEEILESGCLD